MNFVQTAFLVGGAAIAIPVLVHMLSRWQVRQIEVGTMRFLQEVIRDGAQRRRIRRWLLLLTRAAICGLLALLFARPYLKQQVSRDGDRLRVVLVDKSASMGMPATSGRLVDEALMTANDQVSQLGEDAQIKLAWFDSQVHPLAQGKSRFQEPKSLTGDTDYAAAISWARDQVNAQPNAIADVVIVTDLQQSGLQGSVQDTALGAGELSFPRDVPVKLIDVGRAAANNLAITHIAIPAKRMDASQGVVLNVTLFNYGNLPFEDIPLSATAFDGNRTVRLKKSATISTGQAEELLFDFGEMPKGMWRFTIAADVDDDLAADNRRMTAIEIAKTINVLVLDSGSESNDASSESYYLITALEQSDRRQLRSENDSSQAFSEDGSRFHADVVYLQDESFRKIDPRQHPITVVANAASQSAAEIEWLEKYARAGGKLIVFAGDGDENDAGKIGKAWSDSPLTPGTVEQAVWSGTMPFRISSVESQHSMLKPFADPQHGDLSLLKFRKRLAVKPDPMTRVLAAFDEDQPAITHHDLGRGSVVWAMVSADASWGNWTKSPLYLPLIQQMAADLVNLTGEGKIRFRHVGDEEMLISDKTQNRVRNVSAKTTSQFDPFRPGFDQRDSTLYVVNGVAKESDPTRANQETFTNYYGLTQAKADTRVVGATDLATKRIELWPWFAAALFVFLIGEFCLANRTTA